MLSGLILVLNTFFVLWLTDIKKDIRELREKYLQAVTEALNKVSTLEVKIVTQSGIIDTLKMEIIYLKDCIVEIKQEKVE
jgi:hypothetical protein